MSLLTRLIYVEDDYMVFSEILIFMKIRPNLCKIYCMLIKNVSFVRFFFQTMNYLFHWQSLNFIYIGNQKAKCNKLENLLQNTILIKLSTFFVCQCVCLILLSFSLILFIELFVDSLVYHTIMYQFVSLIAYLIYLDAYSNLPWT